MRKIITALSILLITFFSCKKENRYFDENGNEFVEKGDKLFIIPTKYIKTGKIEKVFIYNETPKEIGVKENQKLKPNQFIVFDLKDTDTLFLDNGVKFMFGDEYGLEVEDKKSQVSGIGGTFLDDYGVPKEVEWVFVIVPQGKGDTATQ
jgi:hypothetical protein